MTGSLVAAAVLGLALTACLWWAYFGTGDDDRAERAFTAARPGQRPGLALSAYFYAHIPILLGMVAMAAGVLLTIGHAAQPHPVGQAFALSGGVALFLAGDAWFRAALRIGSPWAPAGHRRVRAGGDRAGRDRRRRGPAGGAAGRPGGDAGRRAVRGLALACRLAPAGACGRMEA